MRSGRRTCTLALPPTCGGGQGGRATSRRTDVSRRTSRGRGSARCIIVPPCHLSRVLSRAETAPLSLVTADAEGPGPCARGRDGRVADVAHPARHDRPPCTHNAREPGRGPQWEARADSSLSQPALSTCRPRPQVRFILGQGRAGYALKVMPPARRLRLPTRGPVVLPQRHGHTWPGRWVRSAGHPTFTRRNPMNTPLTPTAPSRLQAARRLLVTASAARSGGAAALPAE